ncbi:MAG: hypothetical protein CVU21_23520, partial [Betaproteobacteria bacterium HGW-Betaproteobacteria-15]
MFLTMGLRCQTKHPPETAPHEPPRNPQHLRPARSDGIRRGDRRWRSRRPGHRHPPEAARRRQRRRDQRLRAGER